MKSSFWAAPALTVVAGLVLLVSSAAGWVETVEARDVGGVVVREPTLTPGVEFASIALVCGLVALLCGIVLGVARGRLRRVVGVVLMVVAAAAGASVGVGSAAAARAEGVVTPAPWFALAAAAAVSGAAHLALTGPTRPSGASRYRVEGEQSVDDEWTLAARDADPHD